VTRPVYAGSEDCQGGPGRASTDRGRAIKRYGEAFVGIDAAKARNAVAIAEGGRNGEIRYFGEFDSTSEAMGRHCHDNPVWRAPGVQANLAG